MKTTNRLLAVLLSLVLLCSGLPFAFAEDATIVDSGTCGRTWNSQTSSYEDLTWILDSAGTLTISGAGSMNNYSYTNDNGTTRTSAPWGKHYRTIQTVVLNDGVTSIGNYAFRGCAALTSVTIPDSVTSIGNYVFSYCTALESVYITDVAAWCGIWFANYASNPLYYAKNLYLNGELVNDLTIPDGVTSIGDYAFYNCTSLTSVTIPDSVTSIEGDAFSRYLSTSNESYYLPTATLLCNRDSYAASWAEKYNYPYVLLDGTDEENTISETVNAKLSYSIDKRTRTLNVFNQGKLISFSSYNAPWRKYQQYVETAILSDGCTSVSEQAFYQCYNLKRVVLPETMETIDASAFYECVSLQEITIPDAVTSIGSEAFYRCASLQSATIGNGVTSIGGSAFQYCSSLQTATIGNGVTSIGGSAFRYCTSLQNIVLPDGLQSIGSYAFYNCTSLQSIVIPDSVTSMGNYDTFENCTSLKSAVIGDGLTEIPRYAFSGCTALETVSIGENVTSIYYYAFSNCSKLSTVLFGEKVQSIGESAFGGCSSLPAVDLPASVSSIGARAFSDSALKDITIRNKNCEINKDAISIYATIHGYAGSTAETFADTYGYYFNEITDAAPHDHDRVLVKGYAATCTAAGLTDGWQCSVCGIWFEKQKPIKALGHDYLPVETQEPTDTVPGFVRYECTRCDSAYTETLPVTTHTHSFTETERKDATCLENGYVTYTCAACGYTYTDLLTASGHSFGAWRTFLPVEAGERGVEIRFCAVCAAYELRESDAVSPGGSGTPTDPTHAHSFTLVDTKSPTCELAGYNRYMCTCGQGKADIIDPTGHSWKAYTTYAPSCEKAGYTEYRCGLCGASRTDDYTEALGHDYYLKEVAPTCTASGFKVTRCMRCGNELNDWTTIPALGHIDADGNGICERCGMTMGNSHLTPEQQKCEHAWGNSIDLAKSVLAEAATCMTKAKYYKTCTKCGASAYDVEGATNQVVTYTAGALDPNNHPTNKIVPVKPEAAGNVICQTGGWTPGKKCEACGKVIEEPKYYASAQAHKAAPGKEANCQTPATCEYCGKEFGNKDPYNHPQDQVRVVRKGIEPTCGTDGINDVKYCSACDKIIQNADPIPATGKHTQKTAATCKKKAVCAVCGQEYGEVDASAHTIVKHDAKVANCKDTGSITYFECTECGKYFEDAAAKKEITDKTKVIIKVDPATHKNLLAFSKKDATCSAEGNIAYWYCDACGRYYSDRDAKTEIIKEDTVINMIDHTDENNDGDCDICGTTFREPEPEEPQGFFARIAAFFRNLFARLFGGRNR